MSRPCPSAEFNAIEPGTAAWSLQLPSPEEMAQYDAAAITGGVAAVELMERAGRAVYEHLRTSYPMQLSVPHLLVVLCGPGNNGGDGAVVARLLKESGAHVLLVLAASGRYSHELVSNLERYRACGGELCAVGDVHEGQPAVLAGKGLGEGKLRENLASASLVVDALLGIGQRQAPAGNVRRLVELLAERCAAPHAPVVVSVDCPTGINADTGEAYHPRVAAQRTVAIELVKRGMLQFPARAACGVISAAGIGIRCERECEYSLISRQSLRLAPRRLDAHKGDCGRVWVLGGSPGMPGATVLSGLAALHAGAGLVTRIHARSLGVPGAVAELMHWPVDDAAGELSADSFKQVEGAIASADSVILGPGLGQGAGSESFFEAALSFLSGAKKPAVVDADGLNLLARRLGAIKANLSHIVLTPHPGEMERLLGIAVAEVQRDRYAAAKKLYDLCGAAVVLKGASTVVYSEGRGFVNCLGNPYMATAGSGDVASGVIGALLAQGQSPLAAARAGVYIHARAGDLARQQKGGPILASEIALQVARAVGELSLS